MLVSIITVAFNERDSIADTIESVLKQDYKNVEYIIIDGGSTDGTLDVISRYKDNISKVVSEPDDGIYDAMNKGLNLVTGDIIGFLNADDFYVGKHVIEKVVKVMQADDISCCYGSVEYVAKNNPNKVIRTWRSQPYQDGLFKKGWQPPHPTCFIKKKVFEKYGCFNTDFKISADYELMLRLLRKHRIKSCYIPQILAGMRTGGQSNKNLWQILKANIECYQAWRQNGLEISPFIIFKKPLSKVTQLVKRL